MAVFGSPPVRGLGSTGGFRIMIEDRGNEGLGTPPGPQTDDLVQQGNQQPGLVGLIDRVPGQHAAVVRRRRPHQVQDDGRGAERRLRRPAGRLGRAVRERLQPVRPHLAGERPGRHPLPHAARGHAPPASPQRPRRAWSRWAPWRRSRTSGGPFVINRYNMYPAAAINGARGPGHELGRSHRDDGAAGPASSFPRRWPSNGRS